MDPTEVLNKEGFIAACLVVVGGFAGTGIIWVIRRLMRIGERVVDVGLDTMKKVGTNIEVQTGHMQLLTESTRENSRMLNDHGRTLSEHTDHLEEIRRSLGARQA